MKKYNFSFRRVEQKYLLSTRDMDALLKRTKDFIEPGDFFDEEIRNIYFDTKDSELIRKSLENGKFKDKFRARGYVVDGVYDGAVFLEMKNKYRGVVGKRRERITAAEFKKYFNKGIKPDLDTQIMREFDYYKNYYNLEPAIYIAYDRLSYWGKDDHDLRLTFDKNLRFRYTDLKLESDKGSKKFFDSDDKIILEIKTLGALPMWLVTILNELEIYPTGFSKYGRIHQRTLRPELIQVEHLVYA